jgi:acetyltransferase-like isoleucine patch superfamily enzyme
MFFYRALRKIHRILNVLIATLYAKFIFLLYKVKYGKNLVSRGLAIIDLHPTGVLTIGDNFTMNNGDNFNRIGRQQKSILLVGMNSDLYIGDNVKISATAIISYNKITIGNNVVIGGNTVIYDSDFHSLDHNDRAEKKFDWTKNVVATSKPVVIEENVFIGSHTTILKGVTIGKNSIVAACSVVTKNIGAEELWGGNPARLIRKL